MKASGSPVRFNDTLDDNKGTVNGQTNNVTYSSAINLVTLTGNAQKVQRGGDGSQAQSSPQHQNRSLYHQRQLEIRRQIRRQIRQGQRRHQPSSTQKPNNQYLTTQRSSESQRNKSDPNSVFQTTSEPEAFMGAHQPFSSFETAKSFKNARVVKALPSIESGEVICSARPQRRGKTRST